MIDEKKRLREEARKLRIRLAADRPDYADRIAEFSLLVPQVGIIGGYCALSGEADPAKLLLRLMRQGASISFPRVVAKDVALGFHQWQEGQPMQPGAYGILEPRSDWPVVQPELLLVPLLAFDARGHRLGYGGGYYDRTLASLPNALAIGVAFAEQEVVKLPNGPHDRKLDMILTEKGLRHFDA